MNTKITCIPRLCREMESEAGITDQLLRAARKKTNMITIDKQKVRARLEAKRSELQHEITGIIFEETSSGQLGQGVEDTVETAQTFQEVQLDESLLQNQRHLLADVEEALRRLQDGTYGRCLTCGQPIPDRRLEAIPWAVRDVVCEEKLES